MPGVRTRVLVSFIVLLVISTAASVLVLRQVLMSRIGDQVETELTDEVDALLQLAQTGEGGEQFSTVRALFNAYLQQNAPLPDSVLVTFIDGNPFRPASTAPSDSGLVERHPRFATITTPETGDIDTPAGEARYVAVPVSAGDERGVLVAAALLGGRARSGRKRGADRRRRFDLPAGGLALHLAGRRAGPGAALGPVANRSGDLRERPHSADPRSRPRREAAELARTFNGMLDRLETAFANGKQDFLTDVSHELRTPITVIRGHVETLASLPRNCARQSP